MEQQRGSESAVKYRFGVISDTQERKGADIGACLEPLRQLEREGVTFDWITHLGDVASSGSISRDVAAAKRLASQYDRERQQDTMSDEVRAYAETINSPDYQAFAAELKANGVEQDIVTYALWSARQRGELDQAVRAMEGEIAAVVKELAEFKADVNHIVGNADRGMPEKLEITQRLLRDHGITSYEEPVHMPLDKETSVVFWPSQKVDEAQREQVDAMLATVERMAQQMQKVKTVLLFAHETPFKGPQQPGAYEERVNTAGLKGSERVPRKQFLPISRYALELARRLPADATIAMTAGHMHVPRETIAAGAPYLAVDERHAIKMRLFGAGEINRSTYQVRPGQKRTVDLYYLPEGEVGTFEITDGGEISYTPLPTETK